MKNSRYLLPASVTLALLPLLVLLPGCSGGSSGFGNPNPTASPTATATPTPPPVAVLNGQSVALGNGQFGTLNLNQNGTVLDGTITVTAPAAAIGRSAADFSFNIPAGTYSVTGTFNAPRNVTLSGNFPAPIGIFSYSATIPTTSLAGTYSITAGGQTVTGTLPKIGASPTPTSTTGPTPTVTTPPVGTGGSFNLTIAGSSTANFGSTKFAPVTINGTKATSGPITVLAIVGTETTIRSGYLRGVVVTITSTGALSQGMVLPVGSTSSTVFPNVRISPVINGTSAGQSPGSWGNFPPTSGTATITAYSADSISLSFSNAKINGDYGSAKGTLTINGTVTSKYTPQ